jgi:hypothetical protein
MKQAIAFLLMVFSLTAISCFAADRGGVGVGNGRSVYRSEAGFSVAYAESLTLAVRSPSEFGISNVGLVKASEKVSRIEFSASKGKVKNIAEAKELFVQRFPSKAYSFLSFKGAEGLAHEERIDGGLFGIYFVVTSNGDFVEITLEAYSFGNGLGLVAPIVNSFTFDLTRPRFRGLQVSPGPWSAGSKQFLRVHMTDDNSGINPDYPPMATFHLLDEKNAMTKVSLNSRMGRFIPESDGWYRIEFEVGAFLPTGTYLLTSVFAADRANNIGSIWADRPSDAFYRGEGQPALPLAFVTVTNSGRVDVTQPQIHEIRLSPGPWKAGSWNRVFIRASDSESGIDPTKTNCFGLDYGHDLSKSVVSRSKGCRNPKHERGHWYSIEVFAGEYLPDGEFFVNGIAVSDRAGHGTILYSGYPYNGTYHSFEGGKEIVWGPVKKMRVRNKGRADTSPPVIHEIRVDSNTWKVGSKQRLYFRATDDFSGIAVGSNTYGYIVPVERKNERRAIYLDRAIHHLTGDWYYTEVLVNSFIEGGDYFVSGFYFQDKAGNQGGIYCMQGDFQSAPCKNKNGPVPPQIYIRIER